MGRAFMQEHSANFAVVAEAVHSAAPIFVTLINSAIVPAVVAYCCERSTWQSARLLLVSRSGRVARDGQGLAKYLSALSSAARRRV